MIKHLLKNQELFREKRTLNVGAGAPQENADDAEPTEADLQSVENFQALNNIKQTLFENDDFDMDNNDWTDTALVNGGCLKTWLDLDGDENFKNSVKASIKDLQKFYKEKMADGTFNNEEMKAFLSKIFLVTRNLEVSNAGNLNTAASGIGTLIKTYLNSYLKANISKPKYKEALEGLDLLENKMMYGLGKYKNANHAKQAKINALLTLIKTDATLNQFIKFGFEGGADLNTFNLTSKWDGTYENYAVAAKELLKNISLQTNTHVRQNLDLISIIAHIPDGASWNTFAASNKNNVNLTGATGALNTILAFMRVKDLSGGNIDANTEIKLTVGNTDGDRYALVFTYQINEETSRQNISDHTPSGQIPQVEQGSQDSALPEEPPLIAPPKRDFNYVNDARPAAHPPVEAQPDREAPAALDPQAPAESAPEQPTEYDQFNLNLEGMEDSVRKYKIPKGLNIAITANDTVTITETDDNGEEQEVSKIPLKNIYNLKVGEDFKDFTNDLIITRLPDNDDAAGESQTELTIKSKPEDSEIEDLLFSEDELNAEQMKKIVDFYNENRPGMELFLDEIDSFSDDETVKELAKYKGTITFSELEDISPEHLKILIDSPTITKIKCNEDLHEKIFKLYKVETFGVYNRDKDNPAALKEKIFPNTYFNALSEYQKSQFLTEILFGFMNTSINLDPYNDKVPDLIQGTINKYPDGVPEDYDDFVEEFKKEIEEKTAEKFKTAYPKIELLS
ncbi:MAG: hypothetical protein WC806_03160 [Candidatus Gracilibacteria bacterium]|jgi:hypothetical protein